MTDASVPATVSAVWKASSDRNKPRKSLSALEYTNAMRSVVGASKQSQPSSLNFEKMSEKTRHIQASVDAEVSHAMNETIDAGQPTFYPDQTPHQHRYSRSNFISEIFLAEAKAAQAKVEAAVGSSSGSVSSHMVKKIEKPRFDSDSRQNSLSSVNAVGPKLESNYLVKPPPLNSLRVVDDTFQMTTQRTQHQFYSPSDSVGQRSFRKPLGLTFALRRTDSGSTFQSLDGLSNSYPLIRNDGKKKQRKRSASSVRSSPTYWAFPSCSSVPTFDASRYVCLPTACFPMDDDVSLETHSESTRRRSRDNQRDSPGRSYSIRHDLLLIQSQLRGLRKNSNPCSDEALIETRGLKKAPDTDSTFTKKFPRKTVRFAAPLVTKVKYRPFTPQADIAMLYFQEEELEELESDRELVSGDQFECQYDEIGLAVRIAYKKQNAADE
jgi:hypothetical protein